MNTIENLLDKNEKIFWQGSPVKKVFILSRFNPLLLAVGLFFSLVGGIFGVAASKSLGKGAWGALLIPHFWIGFAVWLGPILYAALSYSNTHYAITNKRIFIQKGVFGQDTKIIDFDKITSTELNVGAWDKFLGDKTASILISDGSQMMSANSINKNAFSSLSNIADYELVFKKLKSLGFDVKTDIEFPNAMRPANNPGYNTKIKNK